MKTRPDDFTDPDIAGEESGFSAGTDLGQISSELSVVDQIGMAIIGGTFEERKLLPAVEDMQARYAVSRTALREAYSKLTAKGLITARPRVGTSVRPKSDWNLLDPDVLEWHMQILPPHTLVVELFQLRRIIEPDAAALAAENRTDEQFEEISDAFEEMALCARTGTGDLIEADVWFHVAILGATGNHFISAFSALVHAAMRTSFKLSWRTDEYLREERLLQHAAVRDAIGRRNAKRAFDAMMRLVEDSQQDTINVIAREAGGN